MNKEELTKIITEMVDEKLEEMRINKILKELEDKFEVKHTELRQERNKHAMRLITLREMIE